VDQIPAPHTELFCYEDGDIEYLGVIRDFFVKNHSDLNINIPLNKKSHVYSVRDNAYYGFTDQVRSTLKSAETLLFAQCPYKIDRLKIRGKRSVKRGENLTLNIEVKSKKAENLSNHVVNLKVYSPEKENKLYLNKNLYLKNGKGTYTIPIALNDKKGRWKIKAKEVISGKTAAKRFSVK